MMVAENIPAPLSSITMIVYIYAWMFQCISEYVTLARASRPSNRGKGQPACKNDLYVYRHIEAYIV